MKYPRNLMQHIPNTRWKKEAASALLILIEESFRATGHRFANISETQCEILINLIIAAVGERYNLDEKE